MSHHAMQWALSRERIAPLEKLALVVLADLAGPHFQCCPTRDYLASSLGIGANRVTTVLRSLERAALISQQPLGVPGREYRPKMIRLSVEASFAANSLRGLPA